MTEYAMSIHVSEFQKVKPEKVKVKTETAEKWAEEKTNSTERASFTT